MYVLSEGIVGFIYLSRMLSGCSWRFLVAGLSALYSMLGIMFVLCHSAVENEAMVITI